MTRRRHQARIARTSYAMLLQQASLRVALLTSLALVPSAAAQAGTFPATAGVTIQTNGRNRCATIGDWYTTINGQGGITSSPEPCPRDDGIPTTSTDRRHIFYVEITAAQVAACGGTCTITVNDAEVTPGPGPCDELDGAGCGVVGTGDPARFQLYTGDGLTLLASTTVPSGSANGTTAVFSVNAAGYYRVTSEAGAFPISGGTLFLENNDDNAYTITIPNSGGLTGGLFGALQYATHHESGGTITYDQYFLVGPTAANLNLSLRNFDLDGGGTVTYTRPSGANVAGTASGNGVWNGAGGTLNAGEDLVAANTAVPGAAPDAGIWRLRLASWTGTNQTVTEANHGTTRLPLFGVQPGRAGNFTMTANTTRSTNIGVARDHPFTVTNLFFTGDIVNFTTSGTSANWTVQLMTDTNNDGVGEAALTDSEGNGQVDTGLIAQNQTLSFVLRVTPNAGAFGPDVTTISGVSFMDNLVDAANNTTLTVAKTTYIRPTIAKAFSPTTIQQNQNSTITFTLTNRNSVALTGISFTDTYPAGLVNATPLTVGGACAGVTTTAVAGGGTFNVTGGTIPAGAPGSCTITVVVTSGTAGTYNNTTSGVTSAQTSDGAGPASNTATLIVNPPLTVVKSSLAYSDPFNNTTNPKRIPGGFVGYSIVVTNPGAGALDANTVFIVDPVPADTDLFVGDIGGAGSGPVAFTNGVPSSGLTYTFISLASAADDLAFSNNGGATYVYVPVPNANGVDPAVTHLRINPKGTFAGGGNPGFTLQFRVRVE